MAYQDSSTPLHAWYHSVTSRNVDLVGDFAGANLGAIEGDSLLLLCFSDPDLDFRKGLQLLHAVFLVERFLKRLYDRRCNFVIIFIQQHRDLCVPFDAQPEDVSKFLFAREVIIRHLKAHVEFSSQIRIWSFPRIDDADLQDRLRLEHVYFILHHDGALIGNETTPKQAAKQAVLRAAIRYSMSCGYYVALVNELRWKDSKIMIEVLENSWKAQAKNNGPDQAVQGALAIINESFEKTSKKASAATPKVQLPLVTQETLLNEDGKPSIALHLIVRALNELRGTPSWSPLSQAFILHSLLLPDIDLSSRRIELAAGKESPDNLRLVLDFLRNVVEAMTFVLTQDLFESDNHGCGLADIVDGRLFLVCSMHYATILSRTSSSLQALHSRICGVLDIKTTLGPHDSLVRPEKTAIEQIPSTKGCAVLPFKNSILDPHLSDIDLQISNTEHNDLPMMQHVIQDLTHWHNNRKRISRALPPTSTSVKRLDRMNKRNATEMATYAASLVNASSRILERQVIVSKTQNSKASSLRPQSNPKLQLHAGNAFGPKKSNKVPLKSKPTKKETFMEKIDKDKKAKVADEQPKFFDAWKYTMGQLDALKDAEAIELGADRYLRGLSSSRSEAVGNEVLLYRIRNVLCLWQQTTRDSLEDGDLGILALAIYLLEILSSSTKLTLAEASCASKVARQVGIPMNFKATSDVTRKLSFDFNILGITTKLSASWFKFMLLYYGPYMRRDLDSKEDKRVPFEPDGWQRTVLDELDANNSVFVVAPTSSGKTFISFYAMEQVLKEDDDGVLVYVAPTKALVNQIAAEVEGRFQKKYPHASMTTWAIHTRDHRVHDPARCQILVTVPHILQIMLLSPENSVSWSPRIRRIIFDEIHTIGRAEDGLVWEQLLLLSPCPIIALSATVGNPEDFRNWLASTQTSINTQLEMVQHPHRYSDLRKFKYRPPQQFAFRFVPRPISKLKLSIDNDPSFGFIHPIASLLNQKQIPEDLSLEPRDCYTLYEAICKHSTNNFPVSSELDPQKALPAVPRKYDIFEWEKSLKSLVHAWMKEPNSPFQEVLTSLSQSMRLIRQPRSRAAKRINQEEIEADAEYIDEYDMFQTTLPLLCSLQAQNALPAILFNYDRSRCEALCKHMLKRLERSEETYKATNSSWQRKIETWKSYKKLLEQKEKKSSSQKKADRRRANDDDDDDDPRASRSERMKEDSELASSTEWASFDPEAHLDQFSFADPRKVELAELQKFCGKLRRRDVDPSLIEALRRGIAVHHSGCNRLYRHTVEMLFRRGFIRVVFATGTLALGINMPCVTTVFCGDSVFLTALEYRQASGRAG